MTLTARDEAESALEFKADFCLKTGIAPTEYDALTDEEVEAFVQAYNRLTER